MFGRQSSTNTYRTTWIDDVSDAKNIKPPITTTTTNNYRELFGHPSSTPDCGSVLFGRPSSSLGETSTIHCESFGPSSTSDYGTTWMDIILTTNPTAQSIKVTSINHPALLSRPCPSLTSDCDNDPRKCEIICGENIASISNALPTISYIGPTVSIASLCNTQFRRLEDWIKNQCETADKIYHASVQNVLKWFGFNSFVTTASNVSVISTYCRLLPRLLILDTLQFAKADSEMGYPSRHQLSRGSVEVTKCHVSVCTCLCRVCTMPRVFCPCLSVVCHMARR